MGILKHAIADRVRGNRPSPPRAMLAAMVAGASVAAITYKALRA